MPLNLVKKYNQLLELDAFNEHQRKESLRCVFNRDFVDGINICFNNKRVTPTPIDGQIAMDTLFSHLTTVETDKQTKKREFDISRSVRLHWVKYHLDCSKKENMLLFSVKEPVGLRTYYYDLQEKYVIIFEPLRKKNEYYLLSAYYLRGKDNKRDKIMEKYKKRRLAEVL